MGLLEFVVFGEVFIWICDMFVLFGYILNVVKFFRDNKLCVVIVNINVVCVI